MVFVHEHVSDGELITLTFTDTSSIGYCNKTFFKFSFWTIATFTSGFGFSSIMLVD